MWPLLKSIPNKEHLTIKDNLCSLYRTMVIQFYVTLKRGVQPLYGSKISWSKFHCSYNIIVCISTRSVINTTL